MIKNFYRLIESPHFPITNKCTESLQFDVNDYLVLLVTLLIRHVVHLKQLLILCSCACVFGYPTKFERENACAIYSS